MAIYRFIPTTLASNPSLDTGTGMSTGGEPYDNGINFLTNFAGVSDNIPLTFPPGFPALGNQAQYTAAISYFNPQGTGQSAGGSSVVVRGTALTEIDTGIAIATKLAGHRINAAWFRIGLIDGDLYAGFPTGGGGLLHGYGVQVELRNSSGTLSSTYREFPNEFVDGDQPGFLNLNANPWAPSLASINSTFGINFRVYCSDGADVFELTPNLGVFAVELSVDATPPSSGPSVDRMPTCAGLAATRYRRYSRS